MDTILILAQMLALLCLAALSIYLIVVLVQLRSVLVNLEKDFKEFAAQAIPVLENIEVITAKFKNVAASIEEEIGEIKQSMTSVRRMAENVLNFERKVQERIEIPLLETIGTVAAVFKGMRTFLDRLKS